MTTSTNKKSDAGATASSEPAPLDYLRDALEDLDKAREKAGEEVRAGIDSARERVRDAREELTDRGEGQVKDWRKQLEDATDDALRELGRWGVRAQRSPEALDELAKEIGTRKAEVSD
jgi:vacuolar-type H+-ATPase subunit E/Vma4